MTDKTDTEKTNEAQQEWFNKSFRRGMGPAQIEVKPECKWTYDETARGYESDCGEWWSFENDGTLTDNGFKFCYGCGRGVVAVYPRPEDA